VEREKEEGKGRNGVSHYKAWQRLVRGWIGMITRFQDSEIWSGKKLDWVEMVWVGKFNGFAAAFAKKDIVDCGF